MPPASASPRHGAALIVTLLVLVLLVVIVTGFLSTTRVEQMASRNYSYQNQAQQMAMIGVQKALAQLNAATTNLATADNFVSQPGRVMVTRGTNTTTYELYITNGGTNTIFLNEGGIIHTNINTNIYKMPAMEVETVSGGGTNTDTNTHGRYAYWVDDEGTKANLNAMDTNARSSFYPTNTRSYDYTAITNTGLANFARAISGTTNGSTGDSWPYFFTGSQVGLLGTFINTTVVSMRHSMAGGTGNLTNPLPYMTNASFLNSHVSLSTNTGFITNTAEPIDQINAIITGRIDRANFTNKFGGSFSSKYTQSVLRQIVANINDWPLGATMTNGFTGYGVTDSDGIPNQVLGLRRSIHLNEIAASVYYATNANDIQGQLFVGVELVNPYSVPWGAGLEVILAVDQFEFSGTYDHGDPPTPQSFTGALPANQTFSFSESTNIPAQTFYTNRAFAVPAAYSVPGGNQPFSNVVITNVTVKLKSVKLFQTNGMPNAIRDWANASDLPTWAWTNNVTLQGPTALSGGVNISDLPAYVNWTNAFGVAKNDPRVRTFSWNAGFSATTKAWQGVTNAGITMGSNNSVVNFVSGTGITDRSNDPAPAGANIMNHPSFQMGFVAEDLNVPYKTVTELGRVHTGLQWRTLWTRRSVTTELPPDWALLETFYLTNNLPKMNVNTVPFISSNNVVISADIFQANGMLRRDAFVALLRGGSTANASTAGFSAQSGMAPADMTAVASNVVRAKFDVVTGKPWLTGRSYNEGTNAYFSGIGEVLDITNVSSLSTTNDFINENRAASFLDSVSVASDVFMIYSVGHALAPADSQNAVAEYRCRALVKYDHDAGKFVIQMIEPMPLP